jgi:hypothetical protein
MARGPAMGNSSGINFIGIDDAAVQRGTEPELRAD